MKTVEHIHRNRPSKTSKATSKPRARRAAFSSQTFRSFIGVLLTAAVLTAQDLPDVTKISLEDLMNVRVTSVSKREQKLGEAPAAVFVITQDDIRRSGVRTIPEALRMAPGIEVARIDENKWAITSRGFNGRFANKLLVLIDGRSVYTPLFSGVYWNVQDTLLEDVDRIEVIRGPGATLWGANAVNGVINIITKEASNTQGAVVTADAGNELRGAGSARFGGKLGDNTYYRVYQKYFNWAPSTYATGDKANDGWAATRGGFRIDGGASHDDSYTLQGDLYRGSYGETLTEPLMTAPYSSTFLNNGAFSGGNLLGRWNHSFSRSKTSLQFYYDNTTTAANSLLDDHQNIADVDFQHDVRIAESNEFIWGLAYRSTQDSIGSSSNVSLNPSSLRWNLFSGFTQDEFGLFGDRLRVTVGSKLEHNAFTGFEIQPNARLAWTMNPRHSAWASISRAVRTPARTEEDVRLNAAVVPPSEQTLGLPLVASVFGDHTFKSEDMIAYEAGYRVHPTRTFSADIATFYNSYSHLLSAEPGQPFLEASPSSVHLTLPLFAGNKMSGATYGTEVFGEWKPTSMWKLAGSYSFLKMNIQRDADSLDTTTPNPGGASPRHEYYMRSSLDLSKRFEQDLTLRYVSALNGLAIPGYYSLDARVGWKPTPKLEFSLAGQNLFNNRHLEFIPDFINTSPTQVNRTVHATMTWNFR
ncbi:MAG TPA: TonB-dependent receptor [Terriglobia bacterium]|jgi:iron complex outermembrane receptor protein